MTRASVYLHIPVCVSKCAYCDFLSFPAAGFDLSGYLHRLRREMQLRGSELKAAGMTVGTLYFGGGTPSALHAGELAELLAACCAELPLDQPEWTVEANPGTVDAQKAAVMRDAGVNRVSLGVQDTNDHRLALLGRRHTAAQARQAFSLCREYFPSVSLDVMSGLPGQSIGDCEETLRDVCGWGADHISFYSLKIEEGTPLFACRELALPPEEDALEMLLRGREILLRHGYNHYEIANYARPGHQCRHNMTYWDNRPYLGLGLGAHSFWEGCRFANTADPRRYRLELEAGRLPAEHGCRVTRRQEMEDTMMLGMRLTAGVSYAEFAGRFGCDLRRVFAVEIARLQRLELVVCDDQRIRLSSRGLPLANLVFAEFISS